MIDRARADIHGLAFKRDGEAARVYFEFCSGTALYLEIMRYNEFVYKTPALAAQR